MRFLETSLHINRLSKRICHSILLWLGDLNRDSQYLECDTRGHDFILVYSVTVDSIDYKGIFCSIISK